MWSHRQVTIFEIFLNRCTQRLKYFAASCGYLYLTQLWTFLQKPLAPFAKLGYFRICYLLFSTSRENFKKCNSLVPDRQKYFIQHCNRSVQGKRVSLMDHTETINRTQLYRNVEKWTFIPEIMFIFLKLYYLKFQVNFQNRIHFKNLRDYNCFSSQSQ